MRRALITLVNNRAGKPERRETDRCLYPVLTSESLWTFDEAQGQRVEQRRATHPLERLVVFYGALTRWSLRSLRIHAICRVSLTLVKSSITLGKEFAVE